MNTLAALKNQRHVFTHSMFTHRGFAVTQTWSHPHHVDLSQLHVHLSWQKINTPSTSFTLKVTLTSWKKKYLIYFHSNISQGYALLMKIRNKFLNLYTYIIRKVMSFSVLIQSSWHLTLWYHEHSDLWAVLLFLSCDYHCLLVHHSVSGMFISCNRLFGAIEWRHFREFNLVIFPFYIVCLFAPSQPCRLSHCSLYSWLLLDIL